MGGVDESIKSPLPHIYDNRSGKTFLIETGAEVSVINSTPKDKQNVTVDRYLSAANGSRIATYGNKPMSLQFGTRNKFRWNFYDS